MKKVGIGPIAANIEPLTKHMFPRLSDAELTRFAETCTYLHGKVVTAEPEWRRRAAEKGISLSNSRPAFDQYRDHCSKKTFQFRCKDAPCWPFRFVKFIALSQLECLGKAWRGEAGG